MLEKPNLPLAVSRADGNGHHSKLLRAVVEAKAPGEQAVAHHVLEHVPVANAGGIHAAGDQVSPIVDITGGMEHHRGIARGAGGGVHAHDLLQVQGEQSVGERASQIVFGGEGKGGHFIHTLQFCGNSGETLRVEGGVPCPFQALI